MGIERAFSKRLRLERDLAHDFVSCGQYIDGELPKNKDDLRNAVVNKAIPYVMRNGLLKTLSDLCDDSRLNGCTVSVDITAENWQSLVFLLNIIDRKLDEGDLIQYCLKCYMKEIKMKRCLP